MEDLHDSAVAQHHAGVQCERGAHHPEQLRDPLADFDTELEPVTDVSAASSRRMTSNRSGRGSKTAATRGSVALRLPLDESDPADALIDAEA